jgi:hypothetical protein
VNSFLRFWQQAPFGLWLAIGLADCFAQPDVDLMKFAQPPSIESLVTIDGVRIDGSLALGYDLGGLLLGPATTIRFHLEHRLDTDYGRETRSSWDIPELYGVIAPAGRQALRWRLFGLAAMIIPSIPPGPAYYPVGMGYAMQRRAAGDFIFRNALGWEWVYRDWALAEGRGPGGLQLGFRVQGGRVTAMTASHLGIEKCHMEARYDDAGRVRRLQIGARVHEFQYEADSSRLSVWTSSSEAGTSVVRFSYANELLSCVQEGEVFTKTLAWIEVPHGKHSDCKWPHSVGVGRTDKCTLDYGHGTQGYILSCQPTLSVPSKRITLNNRRGVATIEENKVVRRISFGSIRGKPEAGRLTQVADGEGKLLERYEYNAQGKVAHAWPAKGMRIDYTYDPAGALVGAVKVEEPEAP